MPRKMPSVASDAPFLEQETVKKPRGKPKKEQVKKKQDVPDDWATAAEAFDEAEKSDEAEKKHIDNEKKPVEQCGFVEWLDQNGQVLEPGQRVFCLVLFDRKNPSDLEGDERKIALEMFGCETISGAARISKIILAICGARGGKSLLAAWRLVYLAATVKLKLSPGEQAYAPICSTDARNSDMVLRYAVGIARRWFPEKGRVIEESTQGFTFCRVAQEDAKDRYEDCDRVRINILPATVDGKSLRGRAYVGGVVDEAAFFGDEDAAISDKDIIDAIAPRVMPGGELLLITTPNAEVGEVFVLYERNFKHPIDAVVAHAPTWVMRNDPDILAQVAREKMRNLRNYLREFGAQFVKNKEGMFFDRQPLEDCTKPDAPRSTLEAVVRAIESVKGERFGP